MKKAHIAYYAAGFGGGIENRYENLREAFELAKKIASENKFGTALLRKVEWDDNGTIIKHEGCKVFANGKWEYLLKQPKRAQARQRGMVAHAPMMADQIPKEDEEMTEQQIKALEDKGFKRWTKGNYDRLYINAKELGLECTYYKTGNISNAVFQGERISNSEARRMKAAKTYVDVKTGTLHGTYSPMTNAARELMEALNEG